MHIVSYADFSLSQKSCTFLLIVHSVFCSLREWNTIWRDVHSVMRFNVNHRCIRNSYTVAKIRITLCVIRTPEQLSRDWIAPTNSTSGVQGRNQKFISGGFAALHFHSFLPLPSLPFPLSSPSSIWPLKFGCGRVTIFALIKKRTPTMKKSVRF